HAGLKRVCAAADHVHWFAPGGRKARSKSVAGGVNAAVVEACVGDHALGGLVGYDRGHAGADLGNTSVRGAADNVVQLAHARRWRADAELAADCGSIALIGRTVLNVAEITALQPTLCWCAVAEARTLSGNEIDRTGRQPAAG